jgi:putative PIG3 family NAD(P)H quinone oxidoreductase
MKSVYITEFGGPDNLEIRDVPEPRPPTGTEALVRVRAAGLNRADLLQVAGHYPPPAGYAAQRPGMEFAGEVESVGVEVKGWKKGDRAFGITAGEAQSEHLTIDSSLLARIPENLSFIEAAGVPEVFITAHDAIFTRGRLKKSETLMIHAVGSGVGLAGLQLAREAGAKVIGTSRTQDKLDRCGEFGLEHGIPVSEPSKLTDRVLEITDGRGVDVILDLVGGGYFEANLSSLAPKGRLVLVGLTAGREAKFNLGMALQKRATIIGTTLRGRSSSEKSEATQKFVDEVVPLLMSDRVKPNIDRVFAANEAVDAYKYLASNESFGKVILEF